MNLDQNKNKGLVYKNNLIVDKYVDKSFINPVFKVDSETSAI